MKETRILLKSLYDELFKSFRKELIRQSNIYNLFVNYNGKIYIVNEKGELELYEVTK